VIKKSRWKTSCMGSMMNVAGEIGVAREMEID